MPYFVTKPKLGDWHFRYTNPLELALGRWYRVYVRADSYTEAIDYLISEHPDAMIVELTEHGNWDDSSRKIYNKELDSRGPGCQI